MLTSIDLFCGAGGLSEGFRQAGFRCLYANDSNQHAIETFRFNHARTWTDSRPIEDVDARIVRALRAPLCLSPSVGQRKTQHGNPAPLSTIS